MYLFSQMFEGEFLFQTVLSSKALVYSCNDINHVKGQSTQNSTAIHLNALQDKKPVNVLIKTPTRSRMGRSTFQGAALCRELCAHVQPPHCLMANWGSGRGMRKSTSGTAFSFFLVSFFLSPLLLGISDRWFFPRAREESVLGPNDTQNELVQFDFTSRRPN